MILRNHGIVACGDSIEEAVFLLNNIVTACETQIRLMSIGLENVEIMSKEAAEQVRNVVRSGGSSVQGKPEDDLKSGANKGQLTAQARKEKSAKKWKVWDLEFEAQMRMLDNAVIDTANQQTKMQSI